MYRDAQTDDARLTLMVVRTAVDRGGIAVNHVEAVAVKAVDSGWTVTLRDMLRGSTHEVRTRRVVAATGAAAPPGGAGEPLPVILSKGTHLITRQEDIGVSTAALVLPETDDGRVIFIVPWRQHAVVGTTDTPYSGDLEHPTATDEDIVYLRRHLHQYLDIDDLRPLSAWSGLRALAAGGGGSTASRAHKVSEIAPGYLQVAGGKLTGYRGIAAEVVDRVQRGMGQKGSSPTATIDLHGSGVPPGFLGRITDRVIALSLPEHCAAPLVSRYGTETARVLAIAESNPELAETIDERWMLAEVAHTVRNESAATIADFVQRRTRIAWFTADHARGELPAVGAVMAAELGWDDDRLAAELERAEQDLKAENL